MVELFTAAAQLLKQPGSDAAWLSDVLAVTQHVILMQYRTRKTRTQIVH